jgi:hypothetical protein
LGVAKSKEMKTGWVNLTDKYGKILQGNLCFKEALFPLME